MRLLAMLLLVGSAASAETIYVSDEEANLVHVIDGSTFKPKAPIHIGNGPRGIGLTPDGKTLLVAVSKDNRIAAVDVASGQVGFYLPSGPDPETFAVSPDGKRLYAANEDDSLVSVVDVAARKIVSEVQVGGEPEGTAVSPDGKLVVQASESASLAHVIDASTGKVIDNLLVDTRPRSVAFTPDGKQFWIASEIRGTVAVYDSATRRPMGKIDFQPLGRDNPPEESVQPVGMVFTRDGKRAFVALGRAKLVAEVDPQRLAILRTFPVGWRAWNLSLSPDERRLYTANGLSGDMTAVDLASGRPIATVKLGGRPWGIVAAP